MKALLGFMFTLFLIFSTHAQDCTKHKFVDGDNILKYITYSQGVFLGSARLTFSKESFLLNGRYYKKLIVLDFEKYELTKDYFFREENGKVYLFQDETETLLYNFCLNIGDSFNGEWKVISKVPISTDGGATTRNQFILQSNSNQIQKWIEGIGGSRMVLSSIIFGLCEYYTKNQKQVYYERFNDCASPVKTSHVSDKNIWHLTIPGWISPGYDYWLSFSRDSFLLDQRYYRKQLSKKSNAPDWEETNYYFREYLGRIFSKSKDENEVLSYNYAAEVGDTLYSNQWPDKHYTVSDIENIITLDGTTRRKLTIKSACGFQGTLSTWIEGIGEIKSLDGLEKGCFISDPNKEFNCLLTNNQIVYSNRLCLSSTESIDLQTYITLQPNPTTDHITIPGDVQTIKSAQISDISGRCMLEKVIQNDPSINVASLASGIYICKILWMNGKSQSIRFVKQ